MSDDAKRRILARRARFVAAGLAGIALTAAPTKARAEDDASVEDAGTDADAPDGDAGDASDAIFVEAGVRDGGPPPQPCLSVAQPEPQPQPCLCVIAPTGASSGGLTATALVAAAAIVAKRRRKGRST